MARMNTLIFIRHGETEMAGRFCGHSDPDLNSAGELQIMCAAEEVAELGVQRIYSSDLMRASQTAIAIGQRIGVPIEFRDDLREINFGLWEGLSWQEIEDQFPQEASRWMNEFPLHCAPGGESYAAFTARIDAAILPLLCEAPALTTAIVTHRGVMRYALTRFFGFTEEEASDKTASYAAVVVASVIPCECEVLS
jgi:alpha-ribazole phosphatase/probable phosphoglycerate mutase